MEEFEKRRLADSDAYVQECLKKDAAFWVFAGRGRGLKIAGCQTDALIFDSRRYHFLFIVEQEEKEKWIDFENSHAIFTENAWVLELEWIDFKENYEEFKQAMSEL